MAKKKRKPGPKPLPKADKRDSQIRIKLTAREKKTIEQNAKMAGLKPAVYLRQLGTGEI